MDSSISSLLQQAQLAHQQGQLNLAEQAYTQVLAIDAQQFDALHLLGVIAQQRADYETAMKFYGKALKVNSTQARLFANLGACLHQLHQHTEALEAVEQALRLDTRYVLPYIVRGKILRSLQRYQLAMQSFESAMELQIDAVEAYYERGLCLQELTMHQEAVLDFGDALHFAKRANLPLGRLHFARGFSLQALHQLDEAALSYRAALDDPSTQTKALFNLGLLAASQNDFGQALEWLERTNMVDSQFMRAHLHRGHVLRKLERIDEATLAYQRAAECGMAPDQLTFLLASLGRQESPTSAPADYVRELFDHYAEHFDQHLSEQLDYQLPNVLSQLFARYLPRTCQRILDLGCGTGLSGAQLRPYTQYLIGVDLSEKMLALAAQRKTYDELHRSDLTLYLRNQRSSDHRTDAILLADVLVYVGELNRLFDASHAQLKAGGLLFFTVELDQQKEGGSMAYRLQASQRYAHSQSYLRELAAAQNWEVLEMNQHALRREGEHMLDSLVCVWRKQ